MISEQGVVRTRLGRSAWKVLHVICRCRKNCRAFSIKDKVFCIARSKFERAVQSVWMNLILCMSVGTLRAYSCNYVKKMDFAACLCLLRDNICVLTDAIMLIIPSDERVVFDFISMKIRCYSHQLQAKIERILKYPAVSPDVYTRSSV